MKLIRILMLPREAILRDRSFIRPPWDPKASNFSPYRSVLIRAFTPEHQRPEQFGAEIASVNVPLRKNRIHTTISYIASSPVHASILNVKVHSFLSGNRIVLRAPMDEDASFFIRIRNDVPLQMKLLAVPRPNSLRRIREWLEGMYHSDGKVLFVVATRRGGRAIGFVQLAQIETIHGTAEFGICLCNESQGRGLGGEATALLESYAVNVLRLRKFTLRVLGGNSAALCLYHRQGFREVGRLREQFWQDGEYRDVVLMEKFLDPVQKTMNRH